MSEERVDLSYKYLFSRSLKEMSPSFDYIDDQPLNKSSGRLWDDAYDVPYVHNSYGYRCNEFDNQKIMFLGCSNTYGMGLSIEDTWPYILAEKLGMDYINLAKGGDSAQAQIIKAFQFFKEFYNPEYIVAVLPVFRVEAPKVKKILERTYENNKNGPEILQQFFNNDHKDLLKFAKSPYNLDDILPREFSTFYTFMFIQMLIQYCESNNIKLYWTAYEIENVEKVKNFLNLKNPKNYFKLDFFKMDYLKTYNCHPQFKDRIDFDIAADQGHVGMHYHWHLAELIHKIIMWTK